MSTVRVTELQFQDYGANSHKYYRLYEGPHWATVQYGRIGAAGQWQTVTTAVGRTRLREKLAKGYDQTSQVEFEWAGANPPSGSECMQLAREANKAIGGNVNPVSSFAAKAESYKSPEQIRNERQDAEAAQMKAKLLAMRSKLNPTATVTPEPAPVAATIVDKLGAALAAAKAKAGAKA